MEKSPVLTVQGKNIPGKKRLKDKTSQGKKRPTLISMFSKTHFVLENWPHMLQ